MSFMSACTQPFCSKCHSTHCLVLLPVNAGASACTQQPCQGSWQYPALVLLLVICPTDACQQSLLPWYQGLQLHVPHAEPCKLPRHLLHIVAALLQQPLQVMTQLR